MHGHGGAGDGDDPVAEHDLERLVRSGLRVDDEGVRMRSGAQCDAMMQPDLYTAPARSPVPIDACGLTAAVARYFLARPGVWIQNRELSDHFGCGGWRTEISRCRRKYGLVIDQSYRTDDVPRIGRVRRSGYRWVP